MINISLPYIIDLTNKLENLKIIQEGARARDVFFVGVMAEFALEAFLTNSVFSPYMRTSYQLGDELLQALKRLAALDGEYVLTYTEQYSVNVKYEQYKIALLAELNTLPSYFITQQGGYDTHTLLNNAEALFPASLRTKVPGAIFDIAEAAKCLAYEVGTAAGFHFFRATESVLRRYYDHVTNGQAAPKVRSIRVYVKAMRKLGRGNPKVLQALDQMADLHRNPISHPEDVLTTEDAIAILGISRSAISAMLAELPDVPQTTTTAASL